MVHLEHSHKTSHSKSRLYQCNGELIANVKRKLEVNDITRISLYKSYNSAVVEAWGYEKMTCLEKDCRDLSKELDDYDLEIEMPLQYNNTFQRCKHNAC